MRAAYLSNALFNTQRAHKLGFLAAIGCAFATASPATVAAQAFNFPPPSPTPRPLGTPAAQTPAAQTPAAQAPAAVPLAPPAATQPAYPASIPSATTVGVPPNPSATPTPLPPNPTVAQPATPMQALPAWPPAVLPYRDGMPIPQGYHYESRANTGLIVGGLGIWATPYITGLIAAAASGFAKGSGWLALPVAGPFVAMSKRTIDCSVIESSTGANPTDLNVLEEQCRKSAIAEARVLALLTIDGLLQTTGAILTVAGILSPRESLLRNDVFPPDSKLSFDAGYRNGQFRLTARMQF